MIKLEVRNNKNKFEKVLIDDKLNVISSNRTLQKFVSNLIIDLELDTTGTSGALEVQIFNYIKNNEFYDGKIKILDCNPVLYSYDWEVIGLKPYSEEEITEDGETIKNSVWDKVKKLFKK